MYEVFSSKPVRFTLVVVVLVQEPVPGCSFLYAHASPWDQWSSSRLAVVSVFAESRNSRVEKVKALPSWLSDSQFALVVL